MMRPYSDVAAEIAQRNANNYVPPSIPTVKQTPVEIPGVMYQAAHLYQPVVAQPPEGSKYWPLFKLLTPQAMYCGQQTK